MDNKEDKRYLSYEDRVICEYIEKHFSSDDYYDEEIANEEAFDVHFHLSSLRRGILNWYDFQPNSSLLEIGAGFGALTGLFCEKCAQVTAVESNTFRAEALAKRHVDHGNLKVLVGDWEKIEYDREFDYVIVFDSMQCDAMQLNKLTGLLKPQGRLLISFQNCFGIRYLCGMPERHSGRLFDGIRGFEGAIEGHSFSRGKICRELDASSFAGYKFYYPLPDDRLPQLIYTDDYLPKKNVVERILAYCENPETLMCKEDKLYGEIIEQGAFPFMANSFLVECTKDGLTCDVSYAAISADRGKERGLATTIHKSGVVCKRPLYMEGGKSVRNLYDNIMDLARHGIPVVSHVYEENKISLPYILLPTLADYVRKRVVQDSSVFIKMLKELYGFILHSSEEVEASENAIIPRMIRSYANSPGVEQCLEQMEWGPILKKAYIEMVSLNCFYNEQTGEYQFFDQEYVRENYPAGYVLFRTIAICYSFIPDLEEYVPLQQVKDTFGLNQVWEYYEKEENLFLDEIRMRARYKQLYKWVFFDLGDVGKGISNLEYVLGHRKGKKLILFGTGRKFEEYCTAHMNRDIPAFAVDNDAAKWGKIINGIEVRAPKAILDIPREKRQILICCVDTRQIEAQLDEMGVKEYWRYKDVIR